MDLILILPLCLLATAKVMVQGGFAKQNVKTAFDAIFFNGLIFLFSAVIFARSLSETNLHVFLFGAVFGILTVIFQGSYIKAMSCGNLSITVLIINLNMIIPILVSWLFYHEKLSLFRILGICLTMVAFFLNIKSDSKKTDWKWFSLSLFASLVGGCMSICQKVFSETQWQSDNMGFVSCSYAVAGVLSFVICIIFRLGKKSLSYKINYRVFLFALVVGIILGVFQALNTKVISMVDGIFYYPTYHGGALVMSFISGSLIFKEKTSIKQKICFLVGIVAIVFMCF
jgi:drug/metabolite transporter (DMT)-like permease